MIILDKVTQVLAQINTKLKDIKGYLIYCEEYYQVFEEPLATLEAT